MNLIIPPAPSASKGRPLLALRAGVSLLVLILAAPDCVAGDWTQFRGPGGAGVSDETGLPTAWSETENVRWMVDLPGRGLSNPIIAGGHVYVTACSGPDASRLHVLCFDVRSGKKLWERQFWATGNTGCHPKTNMAAPTPATDGERVYALFATADLACLDKDGNLLWYRSLVGDYPTLSNQVGMAASPVLWKDLVIVPMENVGDSFLAGIDKQTGENRWKTPRRRAINWTTPVVYDNAGRPEVAFQTAGELTAYDPATGAKRWSYKGRLSETASPAPGKNVILAPGADTVGLTGGDEKTEPRAALKTTKLHSQYATPLYYEDRIYNVSTANVLVCIDPADGKVLWQERVRGTVSASPVAAEGKIYVLSEEGDATVVRVEEKPETLGVNKLPGTFLATPAIADGALFFRSDEHLWCIGGKR
jgi:outer membrane protein assembly factor BamB